MSKVKKLKRELAGAAACVLMSAVALSSATYAWYMANNKVTTQTSNISAKINGFVLQIAKLGEGVQHGAAEKSLVATTTGSPLSPASSDDVTNNWYVCSGWNTKGLVTDYSNPFESGSDPDDPGKYTVGGKNYYAFVRSDYILYTVTSTGRADVYFADDGDEPPITITAKSGDVATAVGGSMRVAVTTQPLAADGKTPEGKESLAAVYAFDDVLGTGNDEAAVSGWSCISNVNGKLQPVAANYKHMSGNSFVDQLGGSWSAKKDASGRYIAPASNPTPIIKNVGYDGVVVRVYIWMEGTDADCVNGKSLESDNTTYDVTVRFAGVATN